MSARPSPPGIPGWEILGYVGEGGMGSVWKARRADGTLAAVKVAKPVRKIAGNEAASLFRREALACLNLDHPNLVRGLDAGTTDDGRPYLALEFVEGETLERALRRGGALPEARVVEIARALTKALDHAHRLGLLHRDVKPANVMLLPEGGVKLLDLGLVVETAAGAATHGLGTLRFTAPEVQRSETPGPRSDLFCLGATLATAATGEMPPADRGFADLTLPASSARGPLSPGFRKVVERLVKADAAARYASAAELLLDLDALSAGERPLGAILGSAGANVARKGPRVVAIGIGVAAAIAAAAWFALRPRATAVPPGPAVPPQPAAAPVRETPANPQLSAARVYVERFPDDFQRARELLADARTVALTPAEREDLESLTRTVSLRFEEAAKAERLRREALIDEALGAGDVAKAHEIAAAWPEKLGGAPDARALEDRVRSHLDERRREVAALIDEAKGALAPSAGSGPVGGIVGRIDSALARPPFDGDRRDELAAARDALVRSRDDLERRRAASQAIETFRAAFARFSAAPSPRSMREMLDAAGAEAAPRAVRDAARDLADTVSRAEPALLAAVAGLKGRAWCGPRGATLFVGTVADAPSPDEVVLSPLWSATGGRDTLLAAWAGGREAAAVWLLSRGRAAEALAASGPGGDVTRLLEAAGPLPAPGRVESSGEDADRLALVLHRPPASASRDPVVAAWAAAISGAPRPVPSKDPRGADEKAAGRDAFLRDDLGAAWTHLTEAAKLLPWDAEVATLRGRVALLGARALPTAPALFAAFCEGRRAWDLDPKLPAGPALAAEAGMALVSAASAEVAQSLRAPTAQACEAADAMGRANGSMLGFAGRFHLDQGRTAQALALLRRAAAKSPDAASIAIDLGRAEHASGHDDKAREALRRARGLLDGAMPADAAELERALGE